MIMIHQKVFGGHTLLGPTMELTALPKTHQLIYVRNSG